jgi:hypothetical protein
VPGTCSSCHATIYSAAGASTVAGLCYSCQVQTKLNDMSALTRATERHPIIVSVWAGLSMLIAAWLTVSWSLGSWTYVVLWAVILLAPLGAAASFEWARRRWSRRRH